MEYGVLVVVTGKTTDVHCTGQQSIAIHRNCASSDPDQFYKTSVFPCCALHPDTSPRSIALLAQLLHVESLITALH